MWSVRDSNDPTAAISLDAEKAFDRLEWRGTRQGSALSPGLFCLALEPLAAAIRKNKNIQGVKINESTHKLLLYADDILWLASDPAKSVPALLDVIESFSKISGILGLTETWIRPEDSATPAALSSNFSFSHSPRQSGRGQLGNFVDELDVLLSTFPEDGTPLLVFGDFNIHLEKPHATDFTSLLASFDLKRLITTGTHKSGNQLDLVYTRNCTTENILVTPLHVSDHFLITFSLQLSTPAPPPPPPVTFRRNLRSLSPSHLSSAVSSSLPPPSQFSSLDVNTATDTLCSTLISSLDIICPLSSRPARATPSNPWLSEVLREHRTELRAAERKWHKSKDASDLSMYQSLLSSFSVDIHAAKSSYFHNKINSSSNTRLLFKTFNSLLCPPPPPPASSLTADDFAHFFTKKTTAISSQFSAPHTQEPRPTPSTANTPLSSFSSLTEEEVSLLLSSHPTTCPLDPIPSHLLQAISPTLLPSLTHIINSSLHTGTFPTAFKQARVTPLLKKPTLNTSLVDNYRPISLLPFIAKTLERAVFNQLTSFLSLNNQLDVNQSGFKKGHSTETALLSVTEALRIAKAASKSSVLILLDLSAAFDTVNHQILMSTLSSLGITGTSLHWFESYLTGRSFKVAWRGEVSRAHQLTTGVPQGSVLGPLLFSIYTTSLGHIIQAHGFSYHCYADDTQLFLSFQPDDPTVAARVSSCLADISTWMKEHPLQLNLAKTELLVLPANPSLQHDFTIQLESSLITPSRSVRNLGVTFDDQLTFTDHISKTARSCRFALHNIRKIRPFLTEHATQLIVQALVISRLDYCNALLAGLPACATKPLQMIQNAAARLVFNEPKRAHVTPLFISLHWLPLAARIKFKALTLAYRTITGSAPSYFHSLLRVYIPTRHLRSVNERRLVVPSQKATKSLSRTFSFTVPCWWNALHTLIRNAESLTTFKRQLKTNLFRFALGSTIESKTKGIWMWCVSHPTKAGTTLVLLDTEGLGDVDKGDSKHDTNIFCLAVLLSSTLVYNSRGTIDNRAVEELQYVTELTECIKVKSSNEDADDSSEFVKFFPSFIWAVRDFTLERKIDGKDATENEYLEFALKLKHGTSKKVMEFNLPRECIHKFFPSRTCFTFPFPTAPENVSCLESLDPAYLSSEFLEVTDHFCKFVFHKSHVKKLKDGITVTGRVLSHLVKMYVETISSGAVPCLENAVIAMSVIENEAAVKEGLEVYQSGMEKLKESFPVEMKEVSSEHQRLSSTATQTFMKRSFRDTDGKYLKSLEENFNKLFNEYLCQNEQASKTRCEDLLSSLSVPMTEKLKQGFYTIPGGYDLFCKDLEDIVKKFNNQANKGVKAEEVMEEFLKQKSVESETILQTDKELSKKDKKIKKETEKAALLEQKIKVEEEKQRQLEEKMEAERKSNKERIRQMKEKIDEEMRLQREEAERAMDSKLREQADLLEKGFKEKADRMSQDIEEFKRQNAEVDSNKTSEMLENSNKRHDEFMALMVQQHREHMDAVQQRKVERREEPPCCIM
ncbi:unnamed protein product [Leuciscus chuanchicus]